MRSASILLLDHGEGTRRSISRLTQGGQLRKTKLMTVESCFKLQYARQMKSLTLEPGAIGGRRTF